MAHPTSPRGLEPKVRLDSWKEIATYLRRDVTTVQRWEKREGLPVHRHQHDRQGTVFAYTHELDEWLRQRLQSPANQAPSPAGTREEAADKPARVSRRALAGLAIAVAAVLAIAAVAVLVGRWMPSRGTELQARFTIYPPPLNTFNQLAISADGRAIVYATGSVLHLRPLDVVQPRPLPGTEGAYDPFFSPDGRSIAYFSGNELKKIPVAGGPPQALAPARRGRGGSWSASGVIVFAAERGELLMRMPETGGDPIPIRRANERPGWKAVRWPLALPGGSQFLFFVRSDDTSIQGIYLGDLTRTDASGDVRIAPADSNVFFGSGHLAFVRRGGLYAQPFDPDLGRTTGPPFPVAERVDQDPYDDGFAMFALSQNGVLLYRGGVTPDRQLRWFDRSGNQIGALDEPGEYRDIAISRDGTRVAYELMDPHLGTRDIWLRDLDREARLRVAATADEDAAPVLSADGSALAFAGIREREVSLLYAPAAGGTEKVLLKVVGFPVDWSPDGNTIAMEVEVPGQGVDLMLYSVADNTLSPYLATPYMEREPQFSPDGRYLAYSSSESRQREVYVEPIPRDGRRWKISNDFGREPRWSGDGRELFYLGRDDELMAVAVRPAPGGLEFDRPVPLFRMRIRGSDVRYHYAVTANGTRFLVNSVVEDVPGTPLNVWVDWLGERGN